jgi:hypothetical protein
MEHPKVKLLLTFVNLWIDKANNVKGNQLFDVWDDKEAIETGVNNVILKIKKLLSETDINKPAELNKTIGEIFDIITLAETAEDIIDNHDKIRTLIINQHLENKSYNDLLPILLKETSG